MGQDFICIQNDDKKQYVRPILGRSVSSRRSLLNDDYLTRVITSLVVPAHRSEKNIGGYGELYLGSWSGCKLSYVSDYDVRDHLIDYKDITLETLSMLFQDSISYLEELVESFSDNRSLLVTIGDVAMLEGEDDIVDTFLKHNFSKAWKNEYYKYKK